MAWPHPHLCAIILKSSFHLSLKSKTMNTFRTIITSFALLLSFHIFAQTENSIAALNFKLKLMEDNTTWGVFVIPATHIEPSKRSNTGSGQVTLVVPVGFMYAGLENIGGTWIENARVDGPMEAPDKAYISFGFVSDEPRIKYVAGKETLLFTFIPENANAEITLIDNMNDPFSAPNTYGSNPGNDLGVVDFIQGNEPIYYAYGGNLETEAVNPNAVFASKKAPAVKSEKEGEYKAVFAKENIAVPGN